MTPTKGTALSTEEALKAAVTSEGLCGAQHAGGVYTAAGGVYGSTTARPFKSTPKISHAAHGCGRMERKETDVKHSSTIQPDRLSPVEALKAKQWSKKVLSHSVLYLHDETPWLECTSLYDYLCKTLDKRPAALHKPVLATFNLFPTSSLHRPPTFSSPVIRP